MKSALQVIIYTFLTKMCKFSWSSDDVLEFAFLPLPHVYEVFALVCELAPVKA